MSQLREGIEIRYRVANLMPVFEKMIAERAFEACEFSLSNFMMLKDQGADWLCGIPVFPQRSFRYTNMYVRAQSELTDPSQLRGCRIGVPDYSMTLAVWMRGILHEQYGVHWSQMRWTARDQQRFPVPRGLDVNLTDADLEDALLSGDIDVLMAPRTRDDVLPPHERRLRRLVSDAPAAERAYFEKTAVFPINHVVVVRADVVTRLPEAPKVLYEAYQACKAAADARRHATGGQPHRFGSASMAYGLTPGNRIVLERLGSFLHDQKLVARAPDISAIFLPVDSGESN